VCETLLTSELVSPFSGNFRDRHMYHPYRLVEQARYLILSTASGPLLRSLLSG
jgi:hypothetical protein